MDTAILLLDEQGIMLQATDGVAGVTVFQMGFGLFPPTPESVALLLGKDCDDLFVPIILDSSGGNTWAPELMKKLRQKFPAARVIAGTESEIMLTLQRIKAEEALYPGIDRSPIVLRAISYAFRYLHNPHLTPELLALAVGVSITELRSHFRVATGTTPMQAIIYLRLKQAKRLLVETDESVNHIAMVLGIDPKYFTDWFRKEAGISPTKYRLEHRPPQQQIVRQRTPEKFLKNQDVPRKRSSIFVGSSS